MKKFLPVILLSFVNGISFFILIPVLPFVVKDYGASDIWYTALISIFSAAQFIGSAWFGKMSDYYGRKKILIWSQAGTLLSWFLLGTAYFVDKNYLGIAFAPLLVIGFARIADGLTGGNSSVASAYLADITTPAERSKAYGYIGGAFGLAMIIGPGIGGLTASYSIGYLGTAIAAASISFITLMVLIFGLTESLTLENRSLKEKFSIWQHIQIRKKIRNFSNKDFVQNIFSINGIFAFVMSAYSSISALYIIDTFGLDTRQLSSFFFATGSFLFFNQVVLLKKFVAKFGDYKTLLIGQSLMCFGMILYTLPKNLWAFIGVYYFVNLGVSLSFPTIKGLLSKSVDQKKQGEVSGLSESLNSVMAIFAPILAGFLYVNIGGNSFFLIASLLLLEIFVLRNTKI